MVYQGTNAHLLRYQMYGNTNYIVVYCACVRLWQDERKYFVIGTILGVSMQFFAAAFAQLSATTATYS